MQSGHGQADTHVVSTQCRGAPGCGTSHSHSVTPWSIRHMTVVHQCKWVSDVIQSWMAVSKHVKYVFFLNMIIMC